MYRSHVLEIVKIYLEKNKRLNEWKYVGLEHLLGPQEFSDSEHYNSVVGVRWLKLQLWLEAK